MEIPNGRIDLREILASCDRLTIEGFQDEMELLESIIIAALYDRRSGIRRKAISALWRSYRSLIRGGFVADDDVMVTLYDADGCRWSAYLCDAPDVYLGEPAGPARPFVIQDAMPAPENNKTY